MSEGLDAARAFLEEAVYRSRARQAASTALAPLTAGAAPDARRCGLGEKAAIELDLGARGAELFERLWPAGLSAPALERVRAAMGTWVARQDALDRKRNHFLRDFRGAHGYDRAAYGPAEARAFEQGLAAVNAEVEAGLAAAAAALLGAARDA